MIIYNRLTRIFDTFPCAFKKRNMSDVKLDIKSDIKQVLCIAVYVKLSKEVGTLLEKFRHFDPFAELDLVDGVLMVFYGSDGLNSLIRYSINECKKEFDCASSMGMLTLAFNEEEKVQSPPMGMAVNAAILEACRLEGIRNSV